jgi:Methyltransferase domain
MNMGEIADRMVKRIWHEGGKLLGRPRREDVLKILPKYSVGAEIGVFKGEFTAHILRTVQPKELHLIDAWWLLYGEYYPDWGAYTEFGRLRTKDAFECAERIVARLDRRNATVFHVGDDVERLEGFADSYFDWVYLDTSHEYAHTRRELMVLKRKVRMGGLISGDDWQTDPNHEHHGLCRAVMEFCQAFGWELVHLDSYGQWCIRQAVESSKQRLHPGKHARDGAVTL